MPFGVGEALAVGSIASSLIGGGIQAAGAASANRRGYKLAHEQMKWQEQQVAQQRAYNESMYNRYYSPNAQAAQYRAAGLNPQLMNVQTQGMAQSGLPEGVQMPDVQNEMQGFGSALQNGFSNAVSAVGMQSQKDLNDSMQNLNEANTAYQQAQTELTKSQDEETQQRVAKLKLDVKLLQSTFDYKVNQEFWRSNVLNWQNNDLEVDYRRKIFALYNIDPKQSELLSNQSLSAAADAAYKFALGDYTLQQAQNYLNEFALRQYEAVSGRINANAADMNAHTTRSLMPHLASMYDEQSVLYSENARGAKNQNDAFDLKVTHNGKLVKSGFALQYTLYNQNQAAFRYALKTPELLDAQKFNQYATGIGSLLGGAGKIMDATSTILSRGANKLLNKTSEKVVEHFDKSGAFKGTSRTSQRTNLSYKAKKKN